MKTVYDFIVNHQAVFEAVGLWAMREWHIQWPRIVRIYPTVKANGGIVKIIADFIYVPKTETKQTT